MALTIESFQKAMSRTNLGIVDIDEQGELQVHNDHRLRTNGYIPDPVKNATVRKALVDALSADPAAGADYLKAMKQRLIGNDELKSQPLLRRDIQQILIDHETMRASTKAFEDLLVPSGGTVAEQAGLAGFVARAAHDATAVVSVRNLDKLLILSEVDLPTAERQVLVHSAEAVSDGLKAAYALGVQDLGTPAGEQAVKAAVDALFDLEARLRDAVNAGQLKQTQGLVRLMDYCAARASEVLTVWCEAKANKEALDAGATLRDLVAGKAAVMHGNAEYVQKVTARVDALEQQLKDLKTRADAGDTTAIARADAMTLVTKFQALHQELQSGNASAYESSLSLALLKRVLVAQQDLDNLLHVKVRKQIASLFDAIVPDRGSVHKCRSDLLSCFHSDGSVDEELFTKTMDRLADCGVSDECLTLLTNRIRSLRDRVSGPQQNLPVDPALLTRLFKGEIGIGTVIGAHVHGFSADMVDPQLDDRFLVSKKTLGAGAVNTVSELTYKLPNGEEKVRVFKPEESARAGLQDLALGAVGYAAENRIAEINRATRACAEALGFTNTAVRVTVGVHNGQIGFFMEKAGGIEGSKASDPDNVKSPFSRVTLGGLSKEECRTRVGSLARELCKLEWLDWLSGQMDRHWENFLVGTDARGEATVTAIDNDGAFMDYRVGLRKFLLPADRISRITGGTSDSAIRQFNKFYGGPCLRKNGDGRYLIDLDKATEPTIWVAVRAVTGLNNCAKPRRIPQSAYTWLKQVEAQGNFEETARSVMPGNFSQDQVKATAARLREMVQWANYLAAKVPSGVMEENAWTTPGVLRAVIREQVADRTGEFPRVDGNAMAEYLKRDFADTIALF